MSRPALATALLMGLLAAAHPQGFHKKIVVTVARHSLQALVVMNVDGGERCSLIRSGADADHDGLISGAETTALKKRLVVMATKSLKIAFAGAPVGLEPTDTKVSLHEDPRVNTSGLSVAMVFEVTYPQGANPGMQLEIEDIAPDLSTVNLQVFQLLAADGGVPAPFDEDVESGRKTSIRLGSLGEHR